MRVRLYAIPASHPCDTVAAALELKGVPYERIDMIPVTHRLQARLAYGARTAPGLRIDSERIAGSRRILRRLEELAPEPRLWPTDLSARSEVERVEQWGDETLQPLARRMAWAVMRRKPAAMASFTTGARLPLPMALMRPGFPVVARLAAHLNGADDTATEADLAALPGYLDRIDGWVNEGVLGTQRPNAADLQVGSSLRLLQAFGDVRPLLDDRVCLRLIDYFPRAPWSVPAGILPAHWLPAPPQLSEAPPS